MTGLEFVINKRSKIFLHKQEQANLRALYKALRYVFESDEYKTNSLKITDLLVMAYKEYGERHVNFRTLRRLVYFLIARKDLRIRQFRMARVVFIERKLKKKLQELTESSESLEIVK